MLVCRMLDGGSKAGARLPTTLRRGLGVTTGGWLDHPRIRMIKIAAVSTV